MGAFPGITELNKQTNKQCANEDCKQFTGIKSFFSRIITDGYYDNLKIINIQILAEILKVEIDGSCNYKNCFLIIKIVSQFS